MLPAQAGWRVWRGVRGVAVVARFAKAGALAASLGRETVGRTGIQYRAAGAGGGTSQDAGTTRYKSKILLQKQRLTKNND